MDNYEVVINGHRLTVQLSEETAKKKNLKKPAIVDRKKIESKQVKPANKARKVEDK